MTGSGFKLNLADDLWFPKFQKALFDDGIVRQWDVGSGDKNLWAGAQNSPVHAHVLMR